VWLRVGHEQVADHKAEALSTKLRLQRPSCDCSETVLLCAQLVQDRVRLELAASAGLIEPSSRPEDTALHFRQTRVGWTRPSCAAATRLTESATMFVE